MWCSMRKMEKMEKTEGLSNCSYGFHFFHFSGTSDGKLVPPTPALLKMWYPNIQSGKMGKSKISVGPEKCRTNVWCKFAAQNCGNPLSRKFCHVFDFARTAVHEENIPLSFPPSRALGLHALGEVDCAWVVVCVSFRICTPFQAASGHVHTRNTQ